MKEPHQFQLKDFIPFYGWGRYDSRNNVPSCGLKYITCDRGVLRRSSFLNNYHAFTLLASVITLSFLGGKGLESLIR